MRVRVECLCLAFDDVGVNTDIGIGIGIGIRVDGSARLALALGGPRRQRRPTSDCPRLLCWWLVSEHYIYNSEIRTWLEDYG